MADGYLATKQLRKRIIGIDAPIPLLNGSNVSYVNLDNAASTPVHQDVMDTVNEFMIYYSSVHRGTGFKSRLSTVAYDQAHEIVARFVGADPTTNTVIFGKNTTEAVNKLSYRLPMKPDSVVISTQMEHHSNDLPWRRRAEVVHVKVLKNGNLNEQDFDRQIQKYRGRIAIVSVTGASNVSGYVLPIHRLARKAHDAGALILVDAAQLAPHRKINMKADDDPEHLDFVALSAHKMYAPYGTGALIGPKDIFLSGPPEYPGGGTVDIVTEDEVAWAGMPDRDEAGSPNVVGAIAMAAAVNMLNTLGMENVTAHEEELIAYTLKKMGQISGLNIYGERNPEKANVKVGAIPFTLDGISHFKVAAVLGYEGGIGVRSGCFCAHPYVVKLLDLKEDEASGWRSQILSGDKSNMPGMVRASFGCYNTKEDVDRLITMLERISRGDYQGDYQLNTSTGEYTPKGYEDPVSNYFSLNDPVVVPLD